MKSEEFNAYYTKYRSVITAIARKLARSDDDLVQDLHQVGAEALWRLNLTESIINPDSWIRQAIKFKMIDYLRKNNPRIYESLDSALENGDQLERNAGGELVLRRAVTKRPWRKQQQRDEQLEELVRREEKLLED